MHGYPLKIHEATGVTDPAMLNDIEEVMRLSTGGVLDRLDATEFSKLAQVSRDVAQLMAYEAH